MVSFWSVTEQKKYSVNFIVLLKYALKNTIEEYDAFLMKKKPTLLRSSLSKFLLVN